MKRARFLFLVLWTIAVAPTGWAAEAPKASPTAPAVALPNASLPEPGLLAAGQPTAEQLGEVAAAGYKTVLDLRAPTENRGFDEPARVRELGLAYHNLPIVPAELDRAGLDAALGRFREILDGAEGPVLLHCGSSNRVGALLYAHWVLDEKVDPAVALERAKGAGLTSPELTEKVRGLVGAGLP